MARRLTLNDGFTLFDPVAIDERFVVNDRTTIDPFVLYEGLIVYDTSDNGVYAYNIPPIPDGATDPVNSADGWVDIAGSADVEISADNILSVDGDEWTEVYFEDITILNAGIRFNNAGNTNRGFDFEITRHGTTVEMNYENPTNVSPLFRENAFYNLTYDGTGPDATPTFTLITAGDDNGRVSTNLDGVTVTGNNPLIEIVDNADIRIRFRRNQNETPYNLARALRALTFADFLEGNNAEVFNNLEVTVQDDGQAITEFARFDIRFNLVDSLNDLDLAIVRGGGNATFNDDRNTPVTGHRFNVNQNQLNDALRQHIIDDVLDGAYATEAQVPQAGTVPDSWDDLATEEELADALAHIGEIVLDTATTVSIGVPNSFSFLFNDTIPDDSTISAGHTGERMDITSNPNNIANLTVGEILTFNWTDNGEDRTLSRTVAYLRTTGGNAIFFSGVIDTGTRNSIQDNRTTLTFTTPEHPPIRVINSENGRITYSVVDGELFTSFDEANLSTSDIINLSDTGMTIDTGEFVLVTAGANRGHLYERTGPEIMGVTNTSVFGDEWIEVGASRIIVNSGRTTGSISSAGTSDTLEFIRNFDVTETTNGHIQVASRDQVRSWWPDNFQGNFRVENGDVFSRHFGIWERIGTAVDVTSTNFDDVSPDVANSDWRALTIGPRLITIGTQTPFGHIVREEVDHLTIYDVDDATFTGLSQEFRDAANIGDHIVVYYQELGRAFFRITNITTGGDVEAALEYTLGWGGGTFTPPNVSAHDVIGLVGPDPELDEQFERGGYINAWITGTVATEDNLPFQTIAGNTDPANLVTSRETYTNITGLTQTWYFYPNVGDGLWTRFDQADAVDNDGTPTTDPGQIRTQTFAHVSTFEL